MSNTWCLFQYKCKQTLNIKCHHISLNNIQPSSTQNLRSYCIIQFDKTYNHPKVALMFFKKLFSCAVCMDVKMAFFSRHLAWA